MFKALLKKQFKETLITYTTGARSKGSSKARRASSGIWMLGIWALILVSLGASFFMMCGALGDTIFAADLPWLYFAYVTMLAVVMGVVTSVFAVVSSIYNAKDNDLLLSMPIPPHPHQYQIYTDGSIPIGVNFNRIPVKNDMVFIKKYAIITKRIFRNF